MAPPPCPCNETVDHRRQFEPKKISRTIKTKKEKTRFPIGSFVSTSCLIGPASPSFFFCECVFFSRTGNAANDSQSRGWKNGNAAPLPHNPPPPTPHSFVMSDSSNRQRWSCENQRSTLRNSVKKKTLKKNRPRRFGNAAVSREGRGREG